MALSNNGGPAFPVTDRANGGTGATYQGMSLRDWFAGQALAGLLARPPAPDASIQASVEMAYKIADSMLKQRTSTIE